MGSSFNFEVSNYILTPCDSLSLLKGEIREFYNKYAPFTYHEWE